MISCTWHLTHFNVIWTLMMIIQPNCHVFTCIVRAYTSDQTQIFVDALVC